MYRSVRVSRWTAVVMILGGTTAAAGPAPEPQSAQSTCPVTWSLTEGRYRVTARIRPLLFWTKARDVGAAVIGWTRPGPDATRLELLIGTDPDRAPRRINRWGFVVESSCADRTELVGLMTQSDERTYEDADARTQTGGSPQQHYRAIRTSVLRGEADAEVFGLAQPAHLTYRDVATVLAHLPAASTPTHVRVTTDTEPGFLVAVARLIDDNLGHYAATGRAQSGNRRVYLYGTQHYELVVRRSTIIAAGSAGGMTGVTLLDSEFDIRGATGATTSFRIAYGANGALVRVPVRVVYRPRWWIELELVLDGTPTPAVRSSALGER